MSIWEEFLMERAAKRKKDHKKNDPWDDLVLKKYNAHENSLWREIEDPPKTHLRRFLHDNLL